MSHRYNDISLSYDSSRLAYLYIVCTKYIVNIRVMSPTWDILE